MPLRRVVHAEIVADPADDHLARVEPHAHGEVEAPPAAELVGVSAHGLLQMQGGPAGALGMILVRDRGAEERHDAVAGVLVHRPLEAVHALGEELEEAVHYCVHSSGSSCSARSIEPFTSAKRTV